MECVHSRPWMFRLYSTVGLFFFLRIRTVRENVTHHGHQCVLSRRKQNHRHRDTRGAYSDSRPTATFRDLGLSITLLPHTESRPPHLPRDSMGDEAEKNSPPAIVGFAKSGEVPEPLVPEVVYR